MSSTQQTQDITITGPPIPKPTGLLSVHSTVAAFTTPGSKRTKDFLISSTTITSLTKAYATKSSTLTTSPVTVSPNDTSLSTVSSYTVNSETKVISHRVATSVLDSSPTVSATWGTSSTTSGFQRTKAPAISSTTLGT